MKCYSKTICICLMIITVALFFSFEPLFAQTTTYPATFGLTSVSNYGVSPLATYPWSFGTTSLINYGTYPFFTGYANPLSPFYGNTFWGGFYPAVGSLGSLSSARIDPGYSNIFQALQYYQYLSYAYQFYQIARTTPMFYQNDLIADYIGSSLYSYATQYDLSPQDAIITFIRQNLL